MRREIHVALRRRKESNTKRYTLSGVGRENEVTLLSPFPPTRFQTSCFGDSWKFSDRRAASWAGHGKPPDGEWTSAVCAGVYQMSKALGINQGLHILEICQDRYHSVKGCRAWWQRRE